MVAGAFPIVKLGTLAIKQLSKPLANAMKRRAKNSPFFRNYICMPPAQFYHWIEVNVKMKMLGLGKPREVQKLNEAAAIELGAELLGEFIIFIVAAITLTAEYVRQSRKSAKEEAANEERWTALEKRVAELEYLTEKQSAEIRHLTRQTFAIETAIKSHNLTITGQKDENDNSKSRIVKAVENAKDSLGMKNK
ncbi:OPA3-like protein [Dinothrombium tinctorium]|uniref:OPA3-like protein n=1 Tax=Dinothrombium tinctorium TaxID=1965070 RepID=A0A3S3P4B8_9ACAR|nr:OPA3-like protein [Dinothrombium tinctorium]RWS11853.1 OPA3-like protein [Dinothrombium tinctorium]RWS12132.1 OPA3-like protein [Dinothrombium tinctorium]RWS12355.1 OPA3-like protein [Dinothrombium tinctorium]